MPAERRVTTASLGATAVVRNCSGGGKGDGDIRVEEWAERVSERCGAEETMRVDGGVIWKGGARQAH